MVFFGFWDWWDGLWRLWMMIAFWDKGASWIQLQYKTMGWFMKLDDSVSFQTKSIPVTNSIEFNSCILTIRSVSSIWSHAYRRIAIDSISLHCLYQVTVYIVHHALSWLHHGRSHWRSRIKKKTTKNMLNTHPSHAYLMERPHANHDPTQVPLDSVVAASKTDAGRLESCEDALVQHGEITS